MENPVADLISGKLKFITDVQLDLFLESSKIIIPQNIVPVNVINNYLINQALIKKVLDPDQLLYRAIHNAQSKDDLFAVAQALRYGANPNLYVSVEYTGT
ncbi:unnamed protein product, partial [marine sediment metagenome]